MRELLDVLSMLQNIKVMAVKSETDKMIILLKVYDKEVIVTIKGEGLKTVKYIVSKLMSLRKQ